MTRISFAEYGRVYVSIYIKQQDNVAMTPVKFKVDTGADTTTISRFDLAILGYDKGWVKQNAIMLQEKDKPVAASGERINAGRVRLPILNILGYEAKQWPFQIILDENQDFRNLVGRDLLRFFNYSFNNDEDMFTIVMAETVKPLYQFFPGQEINEIKSVGRT